MCYTCPVKKGDCSMQNYKLTLSYDGTRYRGWQKQGNTAQTVQGKLETLLSRALEQPIEIAGSGRTDAGVHARMQVCSFRAATRTIESIGIERCGEEVRLTYTGDGFLYNMVRILTGTLLEVGLGERRPDDMEAILASHSRASAGFTALAQGLFLWDVTY
mgnify:CR=1 FL=1